MKKLLVLIAILCASCASLSANVRCCAYCHSQGAGVYQIYDMREEKYGAQGFECMCDGPRTGVLVIQNNGMIYSRQ